MPKIKSNSGASKRFKITASGRIKRKSAFKNHILTKKSKKRKERLSKKQLVSPADHARIMGLIRV
ncbi:MAG: 50S ribosomal protein L35 [Bacteroidia bacterium]